MDKENVFYVYICVCVCISAILLSHNKEWNNAICSNKNGPRDYHTKWSKSDREKQIRYCLYEDPKINDTNELTYTTETDSQT